MEGKGNWEDAEKKGELVSITSLGRKHPRKGIRVIWIVLIQQMFAQHLFYTRYSPNIRETTRQEPPGPPPSSQGAGGVGRLTLIRFTLVPN